MESEQPLDPRPEEDQRVERTQQRRAAVDARNDLARTQVRRRLPAVDLDASSSPVGDQLCDRGLDLFRRQPEVVANVGLGADAERCGGAQRQLADGFVVVDLAAPAPQAAARSRSGRSGARNPTRVAVVSTPDANSASATHLVSLRSHHGPLRREAPTRGAPRSDPRSTGPSSATAATMSSASFAFFLTIFAPAAALVLPHPPPQQRPVVDGHQRGLVRPVLDEQPRRARAVSSTRRGPRTSRS